LIDVAISDKRRSQLQANVVEANNIFDEQGQAKMQFDQT
jgi:hypothetical protein